MSTSFPKGKFSFSKNIVLQSTQTGHLQSTKEAYICLQSTPDLHLQSTICGACYPPVCSMIVWMLVEIIGRNMKSDNFWWRHAGLRGLAWRQRSQPDNGICDITLGWFLFFKNTLLYLLEIESLYECASKTSFFFNIWWI